MQRYIVPMLCHGKSRLMVLCSVLLCPPKNKTILAFAISLISDDRFNIIARQRAMHAERDIVLANPSVCPSVCHTLLLYLNEWSNCFHHLIGV